MARRITQVTFGSSCHRKMWRRTAGCRAARMPCVVVAAQVSYYSELIQNHAAGNTQASMRMKLWPDQGFQKI